MPDPVDLILQSCFLAWVVLRAVTPTPVLNIWSRSCRPLSFQIQPELELTSGASVLPLALDATSPLWGWGSFPGGSDGEE